VTSNTFQTNPAAAQNGFAIPVGATRVAPPPWAVTTDIPNFCNTLINFGSGLNLSGEDMPTRAC
jgi:hypothetical protein